MNLNSLSNADLISELESRIKDPKVNLPLEIFHFVSRIATLTNVDILVRDTEGRIALSWRDDEVFGCGWHIPGRIVRYQNSIEKTLKDCLELEYGITNNPVLTFLNVHDHKTSENLTERAAGITLLYETTSTIADEFICTKEAPIIEKLAWFESEPDNMIEVHKDIYRQYFKN